MRHMIKVSALLLVLHIIAITSFSQTDIIYPSPTAMEYMNYVDFPVDYFRGVPEINIPIYETEIYGYKLKTSLSYHASGVQVQDQAGHFGTGWHLNAGGCITRKVVGMPDDINEIVTNWTNIGIRSYLNGTINFRGNDMSLGNYINSIVSLINGDNYTKDCTYSDLFIKDSWGVVFDYEPDKFYFNFDGYSGAFYFDKEKKIQFETANNFKIGYASTATGELISFTITTDNGYVYLFDKIEVTKYKYTDQISIPGSGIYPRDNEMTYNSSWFLSKIILTNGQNINIDYDTEQITHTSYKKHHGVPRSYDDNTEEVEYWRSLLLLAESSHEVTTHRLSEISFPNGKIEFEKGAERSDLSGSYQIPSIKLYSFNGSTYTLIDNYELDFEYIYDYNPDIDLQRCYRMYLMEVKRENNGTSIPYVFEYYNKALLPNNKSKEVDAWGYFNDNGAVENAFPKLYAYPANEGNKRYSFYPYNSYSGNELVLKGADRMANINTVYYGSLKKVTYPTGGATEYIYESNAYYEDGQNIDGGGIRIKEINKLDESGNVQLNKEFNYCMPNDQTKSSGKLFHRPELAYTDYTMSSAYDLEGWNLNTIRSENDLSNVELTKGGYVGYSFVTIIEDGNGKIINKYSVDGGYYDADNELYQKYEPTYTEIEACSETITPLSFIDEIYHTFPFLPSVNYNWSRGLLLSQIIYDNTGIKKRSKDYEYLIFHEKGTPCYISGIGSGSLLFGEVLETIGKMYGYYDILTNVKRLVESVTETDFYGNDSVSVEKTSAYNQLGQLASITQTQSNGSLIKTTYKYPYDFTNNLMTVSMYINNVLNKPIEIVTYKNDKVIDAIFNEYTCLNCLMHPGHFLWGGIFLLKEGSKLESDLPISSSIFNAFDGISKDQNYSPTPEFTFVDYDTYGNPLEIFSKDGLTTTYTWDSTGQYPLTKTITGENGSSLTESWTWEPLIGVKTHTDETGLTTTYEYDNFGRLVSIKNDDKKLVESYEYHFKE